MLLHSEWPQLYGVLTVLSAKGLMPNLLVQLQTRDPRLEQSELALVFLS